MGKRTLHSNTVLSVNVGWLKAENCRGPGLRGSCRHSQACLHGLHGRSRERWGAGAGRVPPWRRVAATVGRACHTAAGGGVTRAVTQCRCRPTESGGRIPWRRGQKWPQAKPFTIEASYTATGAGTPPWHETPPHKYARQRLAAVRGSQRTTEKFPPVRPRHTQAHPRLRLNQDHRGPPAPAQPPTT